MRHHERKDAVVSGLVCVCGVVTWTVLRCLYACNKVNTYEQYLFGVYRCGCRNIN